jgi:hypothetical protein
VQKGEKAKEILKRIWELDCTTSLPPLGSSSFLSVGTSANFFLPFTDIKERKTFRVKGESDGKMKRGAQS